MQNNGFNFRQSGLDDSSIRGVAPKQQINVAAKPKKKINLSIILIFIYCIFALGNIIYQRHTAEALSKRAEAAIKAQKAWDEAQKNVKEEFEVPLVTGEQALAAETEQVSSADLLLQAAQAERAQTAAQQSGPQVLDYGAQVAAYEAQVAARQQKQVQPQQQAAQPYNNGIQTPKPSQPQHVQQQAQPKQVTQINKLETKRIFN